MKMWCGLLLLVGVLEGCAGEGDAGTATRVDSAGIVLVENEGPDRMEAISLRLDHRLGGKPSGPEAFYQLYPWQVSVSPAGMIAVLNSQASQAVTFGRDGASLGTFGREGQGPGEFRYPSSIALTGNGEVLVYDYAKRALVGFAENGTLLEERHLTVPFTGIRMVPTRSGLIVLSENRPRGDGEASRRVLYLSTTDTVQLGPSVLSAFKAVSYASCRVSMSQPPLFSFDLAWGSNGVRTAVAAGPEYSIWVYEDTTLVHIVRRDLQPELVTGEVTGRELGEGEHWGVGGRDCLVPPDELVEQRGYGELLPVVEEVAVTSSGGLWVLRRIAGTRTRAVDFFDSDGRYQYTASPPPPFPIAFLPDGRFLSIETDSLDVQTVAIYATGPERDR